MLLAGGALAGPALATAEESPLRVTEMDVCEGIVERRCQGSDRIFPSDLESVTFVTKVQGATGEAYITHVWSFEGEEVRRIRLVVKNASYRTWSTKTIRNLPGRWKAEVLDPVGRSLGSIRFVVRAPEP